MKLDKLERERLTYLRPDEAEELLSLIKILFTEKKYSKRVSVWEHDQGVKIIVVKCGRTDFTCFEYIGPEEVK